jgi:hypothetical protein
MMSERLRMVMKWIDKYRIEYNRNYPCLRWTACTQRTLGHCSVVSNYSGGISGNIVAEEILKIRKQEWGLGYLQTAYTTGNKRP